jgi:hypothetical protein
MEGDSAKPDETVPADEPIEVWWPKYFNRVKEHRIRIAVIILLLIAAVAILTVSVVTLSGYFVPLLLLFTVIVCAVARPLLL